MSQKNYVRYRLNVPVADDSTQKWMAAQTCPSISIRQLIRQAIERDGYADAMCSSVEQLPRRGRPPKSESVLLEEEIQTTEKEPEKITAKVEQPAEKPVSAKTDITKMQFGGQNPAANGSYMDSNLAGLL